MEDFVPGEGFGSGGGGGKRGGGGGFNKHTQGLRFQKQVPKFLQEFQAKAQEKQAQSRMDPQMAKMLGIFTGSGRSKRPRGEKGEDEIDLPEIANLDELSGVDLEALKKRLREQELEGGDLGQFEGADAPLLAAKKKGLAQALKEGKISSKAIGDTVAASSSSSSGSEKQPEVKEEEKKKEEEDEEARAYLPKYRNRKEDALADAIEATTGKHVFRPSAKKRKAPEESAKKDANSSQAGDSGSASASKKRKAENTASRLTFSISDEPEE